MDRIETVSLAVGVLLLVVVLELVRRRKLTEEYSFLWIGCSLALLGLAARRQLLDTAARWLGVYYPPIVLVLALIVMGFVALLWFSVIVSKQRRQIERLIEESAMLAAELRELKQRAESVSVAEPSGEAVASPSNDRRYSRV